MKRLRNGQIASSVERDDEKMAKGTGTMTTGRDINTDRTFESVDEALPEVAKRLVVELTRKSARDMAWLVDQEELNKTTLVNRALQVYRLIVEAQAQGKQIILEEQAGDATVERSRLMLV